MLRTAGLVAVLLVPIALRAQDKAPYDLRDGEMLVVRKTGDKDLPARFSHDRAFLVSINRGVANADRIKRALVGHLRDTGRLDDFLFDWFGPEDSQSVEVGRRVPVDVAQLVIRILSEENIPVIVSVNKDDTLTRGDEILFFGFTQRIAIGSLRRRKGKPLSKENIDALLTVGISQKEFMKILSESK